MENNTTTFIVIRHAERASSESDANLSSAGLQRAETLRRALSRVEIDAIYATPYNRTRQTVEPLAGEKRIAITEYSTRKPSEQLINEILSEHRGKVIVIAAHSFTVPDLIKTLSNNKVNPVVGEEDYDNLFIVYHDKVNAEVLQLKYGMITS